METLYNFKLPEENVYTYITLYNDKGILWEQISYHNFSYDNTHVNYTEGSPIQVRNILYNPTCFRKEGKRNKYIESHMSLKENFTCVIEKRKSVTNETLTDVELFLYVDNIKYIRVIQNLTRTETINYASDLSTVKYTFNDIVLNVYGTLIKADVLVKTTEIKDKKLVKQSENLYDELSKYINITQSQVNMLINQYKLIKRKEPLYK